MADKIVINPSAPASQHLTIGTSDTSQTGVLVLERGGLDAADVSKILLKKADNTYAWQTLAFLSDITGSAFVAGMIMLWSGVVGDIPSGWVLCNGANGSPDLRGMFIIGAGGAKNPGDTGGSATASYTPVGTNSAPTFTGSALATHTHSVTSNVTVDDHAAHTHSVTAAGTNAATATAAVKIGTGASSAANNSHTHVFTGSPVTSGNPSATLTHGVTNNAVTSVATSGGTPAGTVGAPTFTGTGDTIATLPPYYALCYIMKT